MGLLDSLISGALNNLGGHDGQPQTQGGLNISPALPVQCIFYALGKESVSVCPRPTGCISRPRRGGY